MRAPRIVFSFRHDKKALENLKKELNVRCWAQDLGPGWATYGRIPIVDNATAQRAPERRGHHALQVLYPALLSAARRSAVH